jgi:hypothetical protein
METLRGSYVDYDWCFDSNKPTHTKHVAQSPLSQIHQSTRVVPLSLSISSKSNPNTSRLYELFIFFQSQQNNQPKQNNQRTKK